MVRLSTTPFPFFSPMKPLLFLLFSPIFLCTLHNSSSSLFCASFSFSLFSFYVFQKFMRNRNGFRKCNPLYHYQCIAAFHRGSTRARWDFVSKKKKKANQKKKPKGKKKMEDTLKFRQKKKIIILAFLTNFYLVRSHTNLKRFKNKLFVFNKI